jgi:hypothetical protein
MKEKNDTEKTSNLRNISFKDIHEYHDYLNEVALKAIAEMPEHPSFWKDNVEQDLHKQGNDAAGTSREKQESTLRDYARMLGLTVDILRYCAETKEIKELNSHVINMNIYMVNFIDLEDSYLDYYHFPAIYSFSKQNDILKSIRLAEKHWKLYEVIFRAEGEEDLDIHASHLFCNKSVMNRIKKQLVFDPPDGISIRIVTVTDDDYVISQLNNDSFVCGLKFVNEKIDFKAINARAKHNRNVLVCSIDAFDGDDLILGRDDSLSDNIFVLRYAFGNDCFYDGKIATTNCLFVKL